MPRKDPESRCDLVAAMLGIAIAILVAPGVIWWVSTFIAIVLGERP